MRAADCENQLTAQLSEAERQILKRLVTAQHQRQYYGREIFYYRISVGCPAGDRVHGRGWRRFDGQEVNAHGKTQAEVKVKRRAAAVKSTGLDIVKAERTREKEQRKVLESHDFRTLMVAETGLEPAASGL